MRLSLVLTLLACLACFYTGERILAWINVLRANPIKHRVIFFVIYAAIIMPPVFLMQARLLEGQGAVKTLANGLLGVFLYLLLFVSLLDIARLIIFIIRWKPEWLRTKKAAAAAGIAVAVLSVTTAGIGLINGARVVLKEYDVYIEEAPENFTLDAAIVSDIHLGGTVGLGRVRDVVRLINESGADVVFIAGDVFDGSVSRVKEKEAIGEELRKIKSRHGVFAVLGNHDRDSGVPAFLEESGITLLRDGAVSVDGVFSVIGRRDASSAEYGSGRAMLSAMTDSVDLSRPVIVLDHRPTAVEETKAAGADILISGHTHKGQLFPFSLATNAIYDIDYGYERFGSLGVIVSSGAGTWGPPLRVGSRCEVVLAHISGGAGAAN